MYGGLQKFKEFINDLGSTINEFASIPAQHDPHHTRDAQLRRRSSWSDLSSFFKFNKGARPPEEGGSGEQPPVAGNAIKTLPASSSSNVAGNNNRPLTATSSYGNKLDQKGGKSQALSRSPSLRINSNGNVVPSSSKHRRVTNNAHMLQYDSINKGSSVRYQPTKSNLNKQHYPNSAPATPKGSHGSGLLPIRPEYRGQNPNSPLPRRDNRSPNTPQNVHRRTSPHSSSSNFIDQNLREHTYHNNNSKQFSTDPRQDNRGDYHSHEPRTRSASDSRKHAGQPHAGQQQPHTGQQPHAGQSHHGRQELSKENLDTFNCYGVSSYEPSEGGLHRSNSARQARNIQTDGGLIPVHIDSRYVVQSTQDHHLYDQRSPHNHENRQQQQYQQHQQQQQHHHQHHPQQQQQPQQPPTQQQQQQQQQTYPPPNIESNFRPVESYSREMHGHHSTDRFDHDYRVSNADYTSNHVVSVPPKLGGNLYRNPHGLQQTSDAKALSRDTYLTSKANPLDAHKVDHRLGGPSPRTGQQTLHNAAAARFSPNHVSNLDSELMNGAPSQQYYDDMISQISNQIARVSEGGAASQQPFTTVLQKAPTVDDDDNEWC